MLIAFICRVIKKCELVLLVYMCKREKREKMRGVVTLMSAINLFE